MMTDLQRYRRGDRDQAAKSANNDYCRIVQLAKIGRDPCPGFPGFRDCDQLIQCRNGHCQPCSDAWWEITKARRAAGIRSQGPGRRHGARTAPPGERRRRIVEVAVRDAYFQERTFAMHGNQCIFPGCDHPGTIHAAHIIAVKDGGSDEPENGRPLCPNHHDLIDNHGWPWPEGVL